MSSSPAIKKTLPQLLLLLQALFLFSILSLPLASSSSSATTPAVLIPPAGSEEAASLLNWMATLDNQSQTVLSSWAAGRSNPCINWTGIRCSHELAYTMKADEKCDVYSFGVVSMEVLIGRHHGDLITYLSSLFSSSSISTIPSVNEMSLKDIIDQRLSSPESQVAAQVFSIFKIAFSCLHTSPQVRPTMKQVFRLLSIEKSTLNESFSKITLDKCLVSKM